MSDHLQFGTPITIERVRFRAQELLPGDRLASLSDVRVWEERSHTLDAIILALEASIYATQLAPEIIPLDFTRHVQVDREQVWRHAIPRSRVDALLLALPRRLRWRAPAYTTALAWRKLPSSKRPIHIRETVKIERRMIYPDATYRLPEDRFGTAIYQELIVGPR